MAEAQAFETDFWKDANLRKSWDEIVPGVPRKTIPYTLTKEAIELYCRSVGEDHALYFDEAYAKKTPNGGLIAPPSSSKRAGSSPCDPETLSSRPASSKPSKPRTSRAGC